MRVMAGVLEPNYRQSELHSGMHHARVDRVLDRPFAAIADHVLRFGLQRDVWKDVEESAPRAAAGVELLMRPGVGPLRLLAPVRVVAVVDQADRQGFVYGTLQGHPEAGEELFLVERRPDGTVQLVIEHWSRPARWLSRLVPPLTSLMQRRATSAYLRAARRHAANTTTN